MSSKKTQVFKYIENSNFGLQKNMQRPCLKWLDMLYLLCNSNSPSSISISLKSKKFISLNMPRWKLIDPNLRQNTRFRRSSQPWKIQKKSRSIERFLSNHLCTEESIDNNFSAKEPIDLRFLLLLLPWNVSKIRRFNQSIWIYVLISKYLCV